MKDDNAVFTHSEDWQSKARAAGWSAPVASKLRTVEKCNGVNHKMDMNPYDKDCMLCDNKGTITRPLTWAETNEVAEQWVWLHESSKLVIRKWDVTLSSGVRVVMEGNE